MPKGRIMGEGGLLGLAEPSKKARRYNLAERFDALVMAQATRKRKP
jgi:hypothetical protein